VVSGVRVPVRLARLARGTASRIGAGSLELLVSLWAGLRNGREPHRAAPRSIFVLRNNDVGDVLVVTPLFDALRRRFPGARLAAGVGPWAVDVFRHSPYVDEVLEVDAPWFNKYTAGQTAPRRLRYVWSSPASRELAARGFDLGIDVLGSAWGALLLLRAGIPFRLGVRGFAGGHTGAHLAVPFAAGEHVGRTALRFAELLGATDLPPCRPQIFLAPGEREEGEALWGLRRGPRILVGPGGGLAVKCWPRERFAALLRRLAETGDFDLAVVTGPQERGWAGETEPEPGAVRHLSDLDLRRTFALVAAADLVVCNSSMLLHVAAAFSKPAVVLLGESFPSAASHQAQWGYPGLCRSLGREPGGAGRLATVDEALAAVRERLGHVAETAP
jgi:ADP-heptose:LPS heptosyltransferase